MPAELRGRPRCGPRRRRDGLLEPARLDRRERLLELRERRAVPQRQRLSEQRSRACAGEPAASAAWPALAQVLEAGQVDRVAAAAPRRSRASASRARPPGAPCGASRRRSGPSSTRSPARSRPRGPRRAGSTGTVRSGVEQQPRQERPLCPAAERDRLPVALDLQRTEQLYAQGGAHYAFPPIATMYSACIRSPPSVASLWRSAIARISSRHSCQRPSALRRSRAFRVGP